MSATCATGAEATEATSGFTREEDSAWWNQPDWSKCSEEDRRLLPENLTLEELLSEPMRARKQRGVPLIELGRPTLEELLSAAKGL